MKSARAARQIDMGPRAASRMYPKVDEDYATLHLGSRVREYRKQRNWRLEDLAGRLGISVGKLSAVENEKICVDVELFVALVQAFGTPWDTLLPPTPSLHFQITRRGSIEAEPPSPMVLVTKTSHKLRSYHNRLWPLADRFMGKHLEPLALEVRPVRDADATYISHNHEEFLFLLRGTAECLIKTPDGLVREKLSSGDCIYFWSYLPHCIRSTGQQPAHAIDVACSLHADDSESSTGRNGRIVYLMEASHKSGSEQVAGKLMSLRQALGMSASEFASQLGISVRRLNRIDRGESRISLDLLLHACRTFRKPKEYFLASLIPERPFHFVLRANEIRRRLRSTRTTATDGCFGKVVSRPLADGFQNRGMHPQLIRLTEMHGRSPRLVQHPGQEFVYVLTGRVELLTRRDNELFTETLFPGDSCFIDASVPHRFLSARLNPYQRPGAEILTILWVPAPAV